MTVNTSESAVVHDSLAYRRRLAQWIRDSMVVDSVSRTVPTDSLRRLYRTLLTTPEPAIVLQEIDCERFRLSWHYGPLPVMDAVQRMLDATWNAEDRAARARVEARLPSHGAIVVSPQTCAVKEPHGPVTIGNSSLYTRGPRPLYAGP